MALATGTSQAEAYRRAYPTSRKWKAEVLHSRASEMAADRKVAARLAGLQAKVADVAILKAADILEETRRIALSTPAGIIDEKTGKVRLPHELDAATAASISSFEIDDMGRIKYRFWDKNSSLERAAKILGLFEKDNGQKTNPLTELLATLNGNVLGPRPGAEQPEGEGDD